MVLAPTPRDSDELAEFRAFLRRFDPASIAATAGALQLLPANGHHLWRLDALGSLAACGSSGGRALRTGEVRELLASGAFAALAERQEDLFDDVLVEEVAFHGGVYRVSSGLAEDGVTLLRWVMLAVLGIEALSRESRRGLITIAAAVLRLSDRILRDAGLELFVAPKARSGSLEVPGASRLHAMRERLTFTEAELAAAIKRPDISCIEPLIGVSGCAEESVGRLVSGASSQWPLQQYGDDIIVAKPFDLAVALKHLLVQRVLAEVGPDAIASAFGSTVDRDALCALEHLGVSPRVQSVRTADQPWTEIHARLDEGLELSCLVVTDDFEGTDPAEPFGVWAGSDELIARAHQRLEEIAATAAGQVMGLVAAQSFGRSAVMGMRDARALNLELRTVSVVDLETICFLEADDAVGIWKWARAANALSERSRVVAFGARDLYGVYLSGEASYRHLGEANPITISPGSATDVNLRFKRQRDQRAIPFVDGTLREVRKTGEGVADRPIYFPKYLGDRLVLFVGSMPLPVWVIGPADDVGESYDLVDTVAYWLSEMGDSFTELLTSLASVMSCLAIEVGVTQPDRWWRSSKEAPDGVAAERELDGARLEILFGSEVLDRLPAADNDADRLIVQQLALGLNAVASTRGLQGLDESQIAAAVEATAPPGVKKHLLHIPQGGNEMLEQSDRPPRLVQVPDVTEARERLADHLRTQGWEAGVVPEVRRDELLKSAVAFLFSEACVVLDATGPSGLLESLLAENERLVAATEHRQATLPARIATYPLSAARLGAETAKHNQAAICLRFLIEYVAARPPAGEEIWSVRRLDRCLGLVAEMLDWAYLDDAVHAGLSSSDLLIRDDWQLRLVALDRYEEGRTAFFDKRLIETRELSASVFPRRFESDGGDPNATLDMLEDPMRAEAGLSLTELADLLHAAAALAREMDVEVVRLPQAEAVERLAAATGHSQEAVSSGCSYLALGPRASFLEPPSGTKRDVLPSRFARRWSYVRRPFVIADEGDGSALLWGRRHPLGALRTLVSQLVSGQYQHLAEGKELQAALGVITSTAGEMFERLVLEQIRGIGLTAEGRVTQLGGDKISRTPDGDLGDIDVLAADPGTRRVLVVECKDLAASITPSDYVAEMSDHFSGDAGSSVARLRKRVEWVEERIDQALRLLGVTPGPGRQWRVEPLLVTSESVIAPLIWDVGVPVMALRDLPAIAKKRQEPRTSRGRRKRGGHKK